MTLKRILANVVYWTGKIAVAVFWVIVVGMGVTCIYMLYQQTVHNWETTRWILAFLAVALVALWYALRLWEWANDARRES